MNALSIVLLFASVIAGGFLAEFLNSKKDKSIQLLLTFSGAYLLAISILHLIPEIFSAKNTTSIGLFILIGFLIQIILEFFSKGIEHGHLHKEDTISLSVLISLCLHALLEGIPLGGDLHSHRHNSLLTGIVLHKIPVSILLMTFFLKSKMPKQKAYSLLILFAFMSPIGVISGNLLALIENYQIEITAIVTGMLLHISTTILVESTNTHELSIQKILAIIIGALIVFLTL